MEKIVIIIPTYNEVENISYIISEIFICISNVSILVVDDNSPDGTKSIVNKLQIKHPEKLFLLNRKEKKGLGPAYSDGFGWALQNNYDIIFEMDADHSHDPKEITKMIKILQDGFDLVVGSRYKDGINVLNWPLGRILLSYMASIYVRIITGMPITDPTSGFVGYKSTVLKKIGLNNIKFQGYAFQIEMKYKAWTNSFRLIEHPIIFKNRVRGESKMNINIFWEAIFGVIKLRLFK
jgi:dolichol-phosphate mannosyltransferase|tara:strand:+ start:4005 stop:4712 length:708 start_codon:yes stop_codon:yes gene_type:complete